MPNDTTTRLRLPVNGRGEPLCYASPAPGGVVMVRVDDDSQPAFWLELYLEERHLLALLAMVRKATNEGGR